MARWRKSFLAATTAERDALLQAEAHARRIAVQVECAERCADSAVGIADCTDVRIKVSRVRWFRSNGSLCVRTSVIMDRSGRIHSFNWRVPVPFRVPRARRSVHSWGLTPGE